MSTPVLAESVALALRTLTAALRAAEGAERDKMLPRYHGETEGALARFSAATLRGLTGGAPGLTSKAALGLTAATQARIRRAVWCREDALALADACEGLAAEWERLSDNLAAATTAANDAA